MHGKGSARSERTRGSQWCLVKAQLCALLRSSLSPWAAFARWASPRCSATPCSKRSHRDNVVPRVERAARRVEGAVVHKDDRDGCTRARGAWDERTARWGASGVGWGSCQTGGFDAIASSPFGFKHGSRGYGGGSVAGCTAGPEHVRSWQCTRHPLGQLRPTMVGGRTVALAGRCVAGQLLGQVGCGGLDPVHRPRLLFRLPELGIDAALGSPAGVAGVCTGGVNVLVSARAAAPHNYHHHGSRWRGEPERAAVAEAGGRA